MTKFSAYLFRNVYKDVVVFWVMTFCLMLGRWKRSGEESVWEFKVEEWM